MPNATFPVSASARLASRMFQLAAALTAFFTACWGVSAEVRAMRVAAQRRYPFVEL